jgi:hypothetical protein
MPPEWHLSEAEWNALDARWPFPDEELLQSRFAVSYLSRFVRWRCYWAGQRSDMWLLLDAVTEDRSRWRLS